MLKNKIAFWKARIILFSILLILFAISAIAHCPLCAGATGAVAATTRIFGIDDLIVGTFIGGFVISTAYWFHRILLKKNKNKSYIRFQLPVIIIVSLLLTFITFYFAGLVGNNILIFGIDKILVGTFFGSLITIFAFGFNAFLKKIYGRSFFPLQAIALTFIFLLLASLTYGLVGLI